MTYTNHSTVNDNEDEDDEPERPDVESQDEEDMGYGTRPGGGFTSVVSHPVS
jgi:hypothetical protein